jgi:oligogalacturonide lyase
LAASDIETEEEIHYPLSAVEWSVHFTISPDGKLFAGDGGGPNSVAKPNNGQWIYLFRPDGDQLQAERLVCLADHDYKLEPNVHFSPDMKWIIFRSNMHGASHVYAVEIEKSA